MVVGGLLRAGPSGFLNNMRFYSYFIVDVICPDRLARWSMATDSNSKSLKNRPRIPKIALFVDGLTHRHFWPPTRVLPENDNILVGLLHSNRHYADTVALKMAFCRDLWVDH